MNSLGKDIWAGLTDWLEHKWLGDGRKSRALKAQRMRRYHSSVFYHSSRNGTQVLEDLLGRPWSEELDVLHDPLMGLKKRNQGLMLKDEMGRSWKKTWTLNTDLSTPGFTQHLLMLSRRVTLTERPGRSEKGKWVNT